MGFSVLSLIEIIYFISLRPYFAHRRKTNMIKVNQKIVQQHKKQHFYDETFTIKKRSTFGRVKQRIKGETIAIYPFNH